MQIVRSHYLSDGKMFNDGRTVDIIRVEREEDFDLLLNNIIRSNYYDNAYFNHHIDYQEGQVKFDAFYLASIIRSIKPKSVLELGCGRGDVLFLLGADKKIKIRGIEFSRDVLENSWPSLEGKLDYGDVLEVCKGYESRKHTFDTYCAFDFWEHLLPRKLHDYIDSLVALAEKDALFFFTIPAFGADKVFGEIFPLELEENREKFNLRLPFDYLNAESTNPPIPAQGHLIWAHSDWWQKQFERHGLVRVERLEQLVHQYFDEHLFYARKSFYIFHLDTPQARRRVTRLLSPGLTSFKKWKIFVEQQELIGFFKKKQEGPFIDHSKLKSTINHAEFQMILDIKEQIERRIWKSPEHKKTGSWIRPFLSRLEHWAYQYFDHYLARQKKRHYRFD